MTENARDKWAEWLLERRFGGVDPERKKAFVDFLIPVRDRVLENAGLSGVEILLDVGAGDGLIAFGALARLGEGGRVIFTDISQDLLDHSERLAKEAGVAERCSFLRASADDLSALGDGSVDVVTTRSVLIYVEDKQRAFAEFHRILKPGGRFSIFEPINRFSSRSYSTEAGFFNGYDVTPVRDVARKVWSVYERIQPPDTDPMLDFDERDLLDLAEDAGFEEVHLDYEAEVTPGDRATWGRVHDWDTFLESSGNPKIPTMKEAMNETLTPEETERFTEYLRPLVERNERTARTASAYLWAVKGGA